MSRLLTAASLLLCAALAAAQEPQTPATPAPDPNAGPGYLFAHAAPASPEEALRALELFAASPAVLLVVTPLPGAGVDVNLGVGASKPVLVARQACTPDSPNCAASLEQGPDSFLAVGVDAAGGFAGDAYLHRRAHRASRWSVLALPDYVPFAQPRLDLALLRDDSVDVLLVGTSSLLQPGPDAKSPFGATLVFGPLPADAGPLRLFEVSDSGIRPHVPQEPAPPAQADPAPTASGK
jgi:hypothetical protein